jgi:uncharacterized protein YjbI with pentapeptide repeats
MPEPSEPRKKRNRVTYKATSKGIEMAERALRRFGFESREAFAQSILMSRGTVNKFFIGEGIQLDSFQRICEKLTLDWRVVTGMNLEILSFAPKIIGNQDNELDAIENQPVQRTVVVRDKENRTVKAQITLKGDLNSAPHWNTLQSIIKEYAGDSIEIIDIQSGSIKLFLSGSPEDIERLKTLISSGRLSELDGFPIQSIEPIEGRGEERDNTESNSKWKLVEEIIANPLPYRQLQGIDLSDVDLSGADLSGANFSGANLSGADLNGADLFRANFSGANFSGVNLREANLRGAFLSGVNLSGAFLIEANLIEANLSGADLSRANLIEANLREANLIEANLIEANLFGANLIEADLIRAILSRADLIRADLFGANLSETDLSRANVNNAIFTDSIGLSDSDRANLERRGAIFGDRPPVTVY